MDEYINVPIMRYWQPTGANAGKRTKDALNSGDYFLMPKRDGAFYRYTKYQEKSYLYSRQESVNGGYVEKSANVPHIIEFLHANVPNNSIILGEIGYPKGNSALTTTIMGCTPGRAVQRQQKQGLIHFAMFDVLAYGGQGQMNVPALQRQELLTAIYQKISFPSYIERLPVYTENLEEVLAMLLADGEEGAVLYKKDEIYYPGLRKAGVTLKIKKKMDEMDAICIGFEQPTKEYTGELIDEFGEIQGEWPYWENGAPVTKLYANGWCGALQIGVIKDGRVSPIGTVSSGLTDELREAIKKSPNDFLNKPVLLRAMEAFEGALRHPVFIRFRDDIDVKDCTWEKIFG